PDHREEGLADRAIDMGDGQALADRLAVALLAAPTHVARARGAIVRLHPTPTAPTVDEPLEQGSPPLRGPATRLELARVVPELRSVGQVLLPANVGRVVIPQEYLQLVEGEAPPRPRRAQPKDSPFPALSPVSIGARVGGIGQDQVDRLIARLRPDQLAMVRPAVHTPREPQAVVAEEVQHGLRRPVPLELVEDRPERALDLPVGIKLHAAI